MESVSHKQNKSKFRFRLKCVKGIRGEIGRFLASVSSVFSVIILPEHIPGFFCPELKYNA